MGTSMLASGGAAQQGFAFQWEKDIPVPESLISFVDRNVLARLLHGSRVISITPSGKSYWARTAKISMLDSNGEEVNYFLKVHYGDHGFKMVQAEQEAMIALHIIAPDITPEPIGCGTYRDPVAKDFEAAHFLLSRFHKLSGNIPDAHDFPRLLSDMHKRSTTIDAAQTALLHGFELKKSCRFGFHVTTYGGNKPNHFPPSTTWESCFREGLRHTFELEVATQGDDDGEMARLRDNILDTVLPRLLRPLESAGRCIEPVLVHGDMWDGNVSIDVETGRPLIFDGTPLWAHNEYELAPMVAPRHKMTDQYIREYVKYFPISEPAEDFRDRLELYCLRFNLHSSSLYSGETCFRDIAKDSMRKLVAKYAEICSTEDGDAERLPWRDICSPGVQDNLTAGA